MGGMACDQCGRYCSDVKKMVVDNPLKPFPKHFCSEGCKRTFKGGGSSAGAAAAGGAAGGIIGSLFSTTAADVERERQEDERDEAVRKEGMAAIQEIDFEGDNKQIMKSLSDLQTLAISQSGDNESRGAVRKAAFKKMELGIRMLRSSGDVVNADFFAKELKSMKLKAFLTSPVFLGLAMIIVIGGALAIYYIFFD